MIAPARDARLVLAAGLLAFWAPLAAAQAPDSGVSAVDPQEPEAAEEAEREPLSEAVEPEHGSGLEPALGEPPEVPVVPLPPPGEESPGELPPALFDDQAELDPSSEASARPSLPELVSSSPRTVLGRHAGVWLELGFTGGGPESGRVDAASAEVGVRYRAADFLVTDVSVGLSYAATAVSGEVTLGGMPTSYAASLDRLGAGNPTLGGTFVHRSESVSLDVGLSLSIPTAARQDPGRDAESVAQRASSEVAARAPLAMRGHRAAFRWAPERFGMAIPFRVLVPAAPLFVEVDGALALLLPVLGDRGVDADTVVELGVGLGAEVAGPLRLGVRLGGVGAATGVTLPPFTLSAEPWVGLRFEPVHVTLRGVVNLTSEDGVAGERGPSFGVLFGAGVEI